MPPSPTLSRRWQRAQRGRDARPPIRHRLPKAIVLAFAITLAGQPVADAHSVYEEPTVYNVNNGDQCVHIRPEVTEGDYDGGESNAKTTSMKKAFGIWDCGSSKQKNAGEILARWQYWYNPHPYNDNTFGLCQETPYWWTNGSASSHVSVGANWIYYPCGDGEYGTWAYGDIYYQGAWRGPWGVWSGAHLFDSGGSK